MPKFKVGDRIKVIKNAMIDSSDGQIVRDDYTGSMGTVIRVPVWGDYVVLLDPDSVKVEDERLAYANVPLCFSEDELDFYVKEAVEYPSMDVEVSMDSPEKGDIQVCQRSIPFPKIEFNYPILKLSKED